MINNIKNNIISEISAKKSLNTLNKIQNAEIIKCKQHTSGQKELLNLFNNLLDTILKDKTLKSESQEDKNKNENKNKNDKILRSSNEDNENQKENNTENEDDDETIS